VDRATLEAALHMAFFTYFPDRNPAEPWRVEGLLGRAPSDFDLNPELMTRFFVFFAYRPIEQVAGTRPLKDTRLQARREDAARIRNAALYRRNKTRQTVHHAVSYFDSVLSLIHDLLIRAS
jgi:hypothetical protein